MRVRFLALVVLVGLALGCGGGGGGSSVPSPFAGTFAGPWVGGGENGTALITVAASGNFAGTVHNSTFNLDGTTAGKVKSNGDASGTISYPGSAARTLAGTLTLSGGGSVLNGAVLIDGTATTFTLSRQ